MGEAIPKLAFGREIAYYGNRDYQNFFFQFE